MRRTLRAPWVYVSFCSLSCVIFGRITAASEEAFEEAVPAGECSVRIVLPDATQELMASQYVPRIKKSCDGLTIAVELKTRPWLNISAGI